MKVLPVTINDRYWWCRIASVMLLGGAVASGIGAIVTGKVLNARQRAKEQVKQIEQQLRSLGEHH